MSDSETVRIDMFDLDLNTLDRHWLEQAKLVFNYGNKLAEAKEALERAKAAHEVRRAETMSDIVTNPEKYELKKTTADVIKSTIDIHPNVMTAQKLIQSSKYEVDICQVMMSALDHRKAALENLVKLHGQQYFATPQTDNTGQEVLQNQKANKLKDRLRRRREEV